MPAVLPGSTVHVLGDTHVGSAVNAGNETWRLGAIRSDIVRGDVPDVLTTLQVGDCVNDYPATQTAEFIRFMDSVSSGDWHNVCGNHDLTNQTIDEWRTSMSLATQSYVVDFPDVRLIMWSPYDTFYDVATVAQLDWLDARLDETALPCLVFCHYPIYNSVTGDPAVDYVSTQAGMFLRTVADSVSSIGILNVLSAHSNFKAWINGHSHSRITSPGLVTPMLAGSVRFAAVNCSSSWYHGKVWKPNTNSVVSPYVTWNDDRIDVRYRNHSAGRWAAINGNHVMSVTGL